METKGLVYEERQEYGSIWNFGRNNDYYLSGNAK